MKRLQSFVLLFLALAIGIAVASAQEKPSGVIIMTTGKANETEGLSPQEGDPIMGSLEVVTSDNPLLYGTQLVITATLTTVETIEGVNFYLFLGNTGDNFLSLEEVEVPTGCQVYPDYDQIICEGLAVAEDITIVMSGTVDNVNTIPYVFVTYFWKPVVDPNEDTRTLRWDGTIADQPFTTYLPIALR